MTLLQDLRYAVRMLLKDPWFTAVAAVALGLGIGVNTTVFTFVNAVLIRGLPFDRPEEIVLARDPQHDARCRQQLGGLVAGVRGLARQVAVVLGPGGVPATAVHRQRPGPPGRTRQRRRGHGQHVRAAAAAAVPRPGLRPRRGRRGRGPGRHPRPQRLEEPLLERPCRHRPYLEDQRGGLRDHRRDARADAIPHQRRHVAAAAAARPETRRTSRQIGVFGRLANGVTWNQAAIEMAGISRELQAAYPESNTNIEARLMTFNERFNGGPIRLIFLSLLGAVGFVLLIACANVANLLLARSALPHARDGRAHRARGQPWTDRPPAAHRERHARVSRRPPAG